ncbi:DMT family transporter [Pseudoalteromonas aurantia]|uniref:EamA family transporter n=1 Tax=Pseudoalteromonas aurantia TaxID=43654 RepID=A0A5S3UXZ7_9GAMM|nr:DMT family transporter [Pseudoalteromonas aurantia]TMO57783.1 EamA family transporter [Pseudoalteromonas aurantia]TMO62609.1 EamA family transporter [Pseudoalteromonas aurantia]TMO69912.1 EamA family transporter [Pseudoalteromonas aurantia]
MRAEQSSLLYLHIAVLLFGGTALFAKLIDLSALDITVYRTAVAFVALVLLLTLQRKKITLQTSKDYLIAILLGVVVGLHWVTYFAGMQMAGIAIGIIAFFTYPVITVFLEPFFTQKQIKRKDIICAVVVLTGIYLLIPEASLGNQVTLGIITGVSSGALFSLRNLLQKRYFSHYGGPQTMLYQTLVASVMLCAFITVPPSALSQSHLSLILLAGIIFTALPHALFASSLRHLSATTAGLISCLQPLYATFLAFMLLAEKPSIVTFIGGLLVVSTAFYETWSVTRNKA